MTARWIPAWWQTRPVPGSAPAAASWQPMPWDEARTRLASELERNLDLWTLGGDERLTADCEAALAVLKNAPEPTTGLLVIALRDHELALIESELEL